jgi:putative ABC transport system permease protein
LTTVDPGFDADGQLTFSVVMTPRKYPDESSMLSFSDRLSSQLAALPRIQHAGFTTHLPLSGQNLETSFEVDGYVPANVDDVPLAGMRGVSDDYFGALGARLKTGRAFTAGDRSNSQPVAVVNEAFARRYFGGSNPLGRRLREGGYPNWRVVVGVIADVKHSGPALEARPEVSLPYSQLTFAFLNAWARGIYVVVRGDLPASALVPSVRAIVRSIDADMSMNQPRPLADFASEAISEPRFRTILLSAFATLAITLASVGIFGVLSYFVAQRTREIGIRVALGASSADILRMVVGRGLVVTSIGLAIGTIAAIPLTRSLETLLFEVRPLDAPTIATVIVGLTLVAALASYLRAADRVTRQGTVSRSGATYRTGLAGTITPVRGRCARTGPAPRSRGRRIERKSSGHRVRAHPDPQCRRIQLALSHRPRVHVRAAMKARRCRLMRTRSPSCCHTCSDVVPRILRASGSANTGGTSST